MCGPEDYERASQAFARADAAEGLARLMRKDLGIDVTAAQMRLFILARWDRVKVLAHSIHDEKEA